LSPTLLNALLEGEAMVNALLEGEAMVNSPELEVQPGFPKGLKQPPAT